jgi:hypothetical protein
MANTMTLALKWPRKAWITISVLFFMGCEPSTIPEPAHNNPVPGNGITLLSPNGRTVYHVGDTVIISWDLLISPDSIAGLQIDFSPNNGLNFFFLNMLFPTSSEFQEKKWAWIIQDTVNNGLIYMSSKSDSCKIFIHDYFVYMTGDLSDHVFSIH